MIHIPSVGTRDEHIIESSVVCKVQYVLNLSDRRSLKDAHQFRHQLYHQLTGRRSYLSRSFPMLPPMISYQHLPISHISMPYIGDFTVLDLNLQLYKWSSQPSPQNWWKWLLQYRGEYESPVLYIHHLRLQRQFAAMISQIGLSRPARITPLYPS